MREAPPPPTEPPCAPAAAAASPHYRRWLRDFSFCWMELPPEAQGRAPPSATLGQDTLFSRQDLQEEAGGTPLYVGARRCLRRAMQEQLPLCPLDGQGPRVPLPPPAPPAQGDEVGERLERSWAGGGWGAWWQEKLGLGVARRRQALRERRRRLKRARGPQPLGQLHLLHQLPVGPQRTLLVVAQRQQRGGFCRGRGGPPPELGPPASLQELEPASSQDPLDGLSSQTLQARGIPRERRRTLRNYLAIWDEPPEPPEDLPASQVSSLGGSSQRYASSSQGSQPPPRKRARMGF
ncbi:hypothetical protein JRQ81_013042 [Phrynocephalus forsythii]|uniref:Uncharacterized protein n=1 Tax=Phrynocephalus forsythii TaxID=171643 RepID=A0A9Q1B4D5_9SAUR|nr:hypothetical protein JRQ81_013042 [Phrynocephalus forsythii]